MPPSAAKFAEPDKGRWHAACLESGGDEDEMLEMAVRREPRLQETGRCREECLNAVVEQAFDGDGGGVPDSD